jgi:hypothetical protein
MIIIIGEEGLKEIPLLRVYLQGFQRFLTGGLPRSQW